MKFTLKDYQDESALDVLSNLAKARKRWHEDSDRHAFSLTAATGSGKTVIAAAVFEALFHGDDRYNFDRDPGAVVLWFSDDPSLNEQTRFRLMESSDRLRHTDLVVVENTFNRAKFEPGKIYFLNTQKLGKKSSAGARTLMTTMVLVPRSATRPARPYDLGHDPQYHRRPRADALSRARRGAPRHG
jgi:type III restriction enzyme